MSKGLIGIERALILHTLVQDKSSIMIRPDVAQAQSITLTHTEYRLYPQGIIFFRRIQKDWTSPNMKVVFYHKGRPLYFINQLRKFENGYGIIIPNEIFTLDLAARKTNQKTNGKIYFAKNTKVHATCTEHESFPLFENSPWLNLSKTQIELGNIYFKNIANLVETQLEENAFEIMRVSKLLLYPTENKVPMRDFFPYPVTITSDMIEQNKLPIIENFLAQKNYQLYIPFCEEKNSKMHTVLSLKSQNPRFSPIDIAETLIKISICKFFVESSHTATIEKQQHSSLDIIALSHSHIALGIKFEKITGTKYTKTQFPLQEGKEYTITLTIPVGILERSITVTLFTKEVFTNGDNAYSALCTFTDLKEEDRRFLYENYTKSKLT